MFTSCANQPTPPWLEAISCAMPSPIIFIAAGPRCMSSLNSRLSQELQCNAPTGRDMYLDLSTLPLLQHRPPPCWIRCSLSACCSTETVKIPPYHCHRSNVLQTAVAPGLGLATFVGVVYVHGSSLLNSGSHIQSSIPLFCEEYRVSLIFTVRVRSSRSSPQSTPSGKKCGVDCFGHDDS